MLGVGKQGSGFSPLGVKVETIGKERQARLRTECADHFPTLPVHRWTSAASLSNLVASSASSDADDTVGERTLLDRDFEFRGGRRRWFAGWLAHTRVGEGEHWPLIGDAGVVLSNLAVRRTAERKEGRPPGRPSRVCPIPQPGRP